MSADGFTAQVQVRYLHLFGLELEARDLSILIDAFTPEVGTFLFALKLILEVAH